MAVVHFPRGLQVHTGGLEQVDVAGDVIRDVLREVVRRFPELRETLDRGMAVSIDGEIIQEPLLEPVEPDSEIHLLSPISGG